MNIKLGAIAIGFTLISVAMSQTAVDNVVLKRKLAAGDLAKYKMMGKIGSEDMGQEFEVSGTIQFKCDKVAEDTGAGMAVLWTKLSVLRDGEEIINDPEDIPPVVSAKIDKAGKVADMLCEKDDPATEFTQLLYAFSHIPLPADELKVGTKWQSKSADVLLSPLGGATASYEVAAFETVGSANAVKITFKFKAVASDSGAAAGEIRGEAWLDSKTGLLLKENVTLDALAISGAMMKGKYSLELQK